MLKQCKHKKILYERIQGFVGVCSKTQDKSSTYYIHIPARNTVITSHCVNCGKQLNSFEWKDKVVKLKVK